MAVPGPDAVLEVGQRLFHVNRAALSRASDYFRALFFGGTRDRSGPGRRVVLRGLDAEVFERLLAFAQGGHVVIERHNAAALLEAADFLLLERLKRLCGAFLQRQLRAGNCLGFWAYSRRFACPGLEAAARRVAHTHLAAVMAEREELAQLPEEALAELLASDELYVGAEDEVVEALVEWAGHGRGRDAALPSLLGLVRAPFLSLAFLDLLIQRTQGGGSGEDDTCGRLLKMLSRALPRQWTAAQGLPQRGRSYQTLYVLGGRHELEQQELFQFHPKTNSWQACSPLRRRNLTQYAVAAVGNYIFVTGGYFRDEVVWYCVDWVLIYNCWENSWSEGPSMKQSRNWHCAVGTSQYLYVLGGSTDEAVIGDVERLPVTHTEWVGMSGMVQPVERAAAASDGASIYVLCGLDENGDVYSGVQRLHVDTDVWDVISFSPHPRYDLCATLLNGALYVMGGQTFRLDIDTDEWTPVDEECLNQKFFNGCATVNGRTFLLGERKGNTTIPNMILFDPYTDTCQTVDTAVPCALPVRGCMSIRKFNTTRV
ncbi:kelch-like protein 23 [Amblyraja radiata]|uniref:kelch-like protein 23 n=1 Tax=Amblyraja radiata TaxID=386614 RepID=UPI00140237ED|nr:kelch-like protein 23 [Amblyraja radiata]